MPRKTAVEIYREDIHAALNRGGGSEYISVGQCAKRMGLAKSFVWNILKKMVALGEVERREVTFAGQTWIYYFSNRIDNSMHDLEILLEVDDTIHVGSDSRQDRLG